MINRHNKNQEEEGGKEIVSSRSYRLVTGSLHKGHGADGFLRAASRDWMQKLQNKRTHLINHLDQI